MMDDDEEIDFEESPVGPEWVRAGEIGVDAGLCWIGDPCYCVTPDANSHPAKTWQDFVRLLMESGPNDVSGAKQWNYALGHAGLGVSVQTGFGDGTYPVYVRYGAEGRVMAAMVKFD